MNKPDSQLAMDAKFASPFADPRRMAGITSTISDFKSGRSRPGLGSKSSSGRLELLEQFLPEQHRQKLTALAASSHVLEGSSNRGFNAKADNGGIIRRILTQDVLYLMICQLPTPEELKAASSVLGV